MASLSRGAHSANVLSVPPLKLRRRIRFHLSPRQNEKAKAYVLNLDLDVLDLEGNGQWGMITVNQT